MPLSSVTRVGDQSTSLDGVLYVRRGSAVYTFSVVDGKPQPEPLSKAERLAELALPGIRP